MERSDHSLIRDWLERGDTDAFGHLYARHAPTVYAFTHGMVGNGTLADDVVQETFLKAGKALHRYRAESGFKTWLLSIARNAAYDLGRKEARRKRDRDRESPPRHNPGPGAQVEAGERQAAVREAVAALPETQRLAVTLCNLQGLGIADAAEVMDCPPGTVKSTLHRARSTLKQTLRAYMED